MNKRSRLGLGVNVRSLNQSKVEKKKKDLLATCVLYIKAVAPIAKSSFIHSPVFSCLCLVYKVAVGHSGCNMGNVN